MSNSATTRRPSRVRLAGALFAIAALAAGCSDAGDPEQADAPAASEASDAGGSSAAGAPDDDTSQEGAASDGGGEDAVVTGSSDGGGKSSAAVPQEPFAVTPAPDGFEPPDPCSGEGAYFAEVGGGAASPDLPKRGGETLAIEATGISGDSAQLTATLGEGKPRPIEDITLGETATLEGWTISVTSVCQETDQVEFDLIN
ncbi:hypothetical protein [Brachybacterium tyrofermentans]|uniref:hypothetical protein n=1 Tax=Brachybacterium tyrofermentans TaxID=47848 RepID=UPI003F93884B